MQNAWLPSCLWIRTLDLSKVSKLRATTCKLLMPTPQVFPWPLSSLIFVAADEILKVFWNILGSLSEQDEIRPTPPPPSYLGQWSSTQCSWDERGREKAECISTCASEQCVVGPWSTAGSDRHPAVAASCLWRGWVFFTRATSQHCHFSQIERGRGQAGSPLCTQRSLIRASKEQ